METTHGLQYHWLANNVATWETAFARYGNNIAPGLQPQHWPSVFRYFQRRLYVWCMSVFLPDSICTWKTREMCRRPGPESSGYTRAYWKWENDSHLASLVGLADGITSIHAGVFKLAFQAATAGFLAYGVESTCPILLLRRRCLIELVTDEQPLLSQLTREEINLQGFFGHLLSVCLIVSSQTAPTGLAVSAIFALAHDISDGQLRSVHHLCCEAGHSNGNMSRNTFIGSFWALLLGVVKIHEHFEMKIFKKFQGLRSQIFWSFLPIRATILK